MTQSRNPHKRYPLERSPFYRLSSKAKYKALFALGWDATSCLLDVKNYRVWSNDKEREIQEPQGRLLATHRRIAVLLSRIELPDYVYSQKRRSYVDNAHAHLGKTLLIKTDISAFYPSVTRQSVFRMFLDDFECSEPIAHRLADICCYKQEHIPTGSPLSGYVAFLAKKSMFDKIAKEAEDRDCKMTLYVDDITISGNKATRKFLEKIRQIIRQHGLKTKDKKSITYASNAAKTVTGVILVKDEARLPNKQHLKIHHARQATRQVTTPDEREKAKCRLFGLEQQKRQILKN